MLWIVGAIAVVLVVAALVWVLRQRSDSGSADQQHAYAAPAVTESGEQGRSAAIFDSSELGADTAVDQTVPLSRLGGAGWRDGGGVGAETTTDAYAASAGTWAEPESDSESVLDPASEHHDTGDDTGARPFTGDDADADDRRGGHW